MSRGPNNIPQNPYSNSPIQNNAGSGGRLRAGQQVADPLGNIFILPRQLDVGLCQGCRNIYGGNGAHGHQHEHQNAHNHSHAPTAPSHQVSY